ncbi:hypothetical protein BT93_H0902 [Corymbia citriodora subsp. variegata]|nr:hypothetical protein BT93_H0902 [Corymbia citriodora subsp. variegata]
MSAPVSAIPSSPNKGTSRAVERRWADFHPSVWGDYFLKYASPTNSMEFKYHGRVEEQIEGLKGEVRKMVTDVVDKPSQMLHLIDQIQRLGIFYHFEREIDEQLEQIHKKVFNKFKDSEGNFKELLITDVLGLLSLYEACHLRCHGDAILEEALPFAITHLESIDESKVSTSLAKQVKRALKQPLRTGLPRLEARYYIPLYQEEPSHDEVLLAWWKDIYVPRKFPFARDMIVELFFWIVGAYFEPEFVMARYILTKVVALTSILDDIYDVYGTLEELVILTEAIEKWDVDAMDGLPEYMQAWYKVLLDLYDTIGNEVVMKERSNRLSYAKEAMKKQVRVYFHEAKWFHTNYTPTLEEYMPLALLTTGHEMLAITSLLGLGDVVTKNTFEWLLGDCKILKASQIIFRNSVNLVTPMSFDVQFEQKRGHPASAVELFMKEHGVSEQETEKELRKRVVDAWKDINEAFICPTAVQVPILMRILNLSRVVHVLYSDGDNYTHSGTLLKDYVTSLFVIPLPRGTQEGTWQDYK